MPGLVFVSIPLRITIMVSEGFPGRFSILERKELGKQNSWALQELKEGRAVTRKRKGSWHLFIRKYKWEEMETIHTL